MPFGEWTFENGLPRPHVFSSRLFFVENVTPHIQFGMGGFCNSCHGVPLLCRTSASDELQIQESVHCGRSHFRAGGWRQVIDLSGHSSGELLQVVYRPISR